jgi:hypothetical protein
MRKITKISLHITVSTWGDTNSIRSWHLDRGWSDIGYHYVIKNGHSRYNSPYFSSEDGSVESGRSLSRNPAAVAGHNSNMIAIALVGKDGKFTQKQLLSAVELCSNLIDVYNLDLDSIKGHYEYDGVHKKCPEIDMNDFRLAVKNFRQEKVLS